MTKKGIGPQGLGRKGNNGYKIGSEDSPAKQTTREYRKISRKFPDFNQKTDTIVSSKGHFIEDNLTANTANAKGASSYLFNKKNKNSGNSKNIVKYVESEDDKSFRTKGGNIVTHSLYKKNDLVNAVSPAKQTKRYGNLAKQMENFNQRIDTLITSTGTNLNVLRDENSMKARAGHKQGQMYRRIDDSKTLRNDDGKLQYITQHKKKTTESPAKQTARSKRLYARSQKNAAKGKKAVDEGRDRRATRLLKRAARQEDKAIRLEEKSKKKTKESPVKKKDACYSKVKSRYKKWPSAYASGALVKCRKVGAANWGNKSKE